MARTALLAIRAYQHYLSPLKGFSCALRAMLGGDSCSAYGYRAIRLGGLSVGLLLLRQRMALCGHVYRKSATPPNPVLHRQRGHVSCDLPGSSCDVPDLSCAGDLLDFAGPALNCAASCSGGPDLWGRWRNRDTLKPGSSLEMDALEQRVRARRERAQRR